MLNLALRRECRWLLAKVNWKENQKEHPQPIKMDVYYWHWNAMLTEVPEYKHNVWLLSSRVADMPKSFTVNWKQKGRVNIRTKLHHELDFLRRLFHSQHCDEWSSPIAQSVELVPYFVMHTDASLEGLGAICHELRFLMRISVPTHIVIRITKHFPRGS